MWSPRERELRSCNSPSSKAIFDDLTGVSATASVGVQNPEPRSRGDPLVLVDEPAEDGAPPDPRASDPFRGRSRIRWTKLERPVWSLPVVVLDVRAEDVLQVTPTEDQDVIQALSSSRADPALRERVPPWGPDRRFEDSDVFGPEDLVEAPGELRVPIPEQDVLVPEGSGDREVPGLLGHPGRVRSAGGAGHMDPSGRELDEEQDIERLQEHRLDREEVAREHSPALCSEELAPGRTGSTRRGPEAGATQDPPDGARSDLDPQLAEFALDSHASPSGVLPAETDDEIGRLGIEGRPTGASPMVGPLPADEFAVPAEEGLGRDHERGPPVPAERPARRGEERPVSVFELRAAH